MTRRLSRSNRPEAKLRYAEKSASWAEKKEAENIVWAAPAVISVDNKIEIDVAALRLIELVKAKRKSGSYPSASLLMTKVPVRPYPGHLVSMSTLLTFKQLNSTMMKHLILIAAAVLANACSPQIQVYSDHDPDYQIKNYKTFDWGQKTNIEANRNPLHYNELNDKRIKSAVLEELTSRGYRLSDVNPDLIIHYHIIIDDQSVVATEPYGYFYGPYWMRMSTHVYRYSEGTLIIDLMDPKNNNLVWRGWATVDLAMITSEQTESIINRVVAKIFRRFSTSVSDQEPLASEN